MQTFLGHVTRQSNQGDQHEQGEEGGKLATQRDITRFVAAYQFHLEGTQSPPPPLSLFLSLSVSQQCLRYNDERQK